MSAGLGQTLRVVFTPTDSVNYTLDTQTTLIDVSNAVKPSVPISPLLTPGGAGILTLTWSTPSDDGDSSITRYEYRVARADILSWPSSWTSTGSPVNTATISGLTGGKSYFAQVRAINSVGESAFAQTASSATVAGDVPVLQGAPVLLSAVVDTTLGGRVTLTFVAPIITPDTPINALLNYQYTTDNGATWKSTSDTTTTILVSGLTNGSTYNFKVRAVNAAGAGTASASLSAIPRKHPTVVSGVAITATSSRLNVRFTPPTDNGGSTLTYRYKIKKSSGSYGDWQSISSLTDSGSEKTFTINKFSEDENIRSGTTYVVVIQALNTWFTSDDSNEATVNATVAQPAIIDAITPDSGFTSGRSFTLSVTAHAAAGETLTYRWYKSTDTITTLSSNSTYTVSSAATANSGNYFVTITTTLASNGTTAQITNSDPITITINGPPIISNKSSIPGATQGQTYSFTLTATGTVVAVTSSATGQILGVFNGCLIEVSPNNRNKPTWQNYYSQTDVSQGNIYAYVIDDPNQVYLVKSTGTALGVSAVGRAFDIAYTAGSTVNGISATALDLAASNSSTGQCLVISPSTFIGNEVNTTNEDFVVRVNKGQQLI